jgi:Skp family chaperone for outer membrane proteins
LNYAYKTRYNDIPYSNLTGWEQYMKLRKTVVIIATLGILNGCNGGSSPYNAGTTYGIADAKWRVMSSQQREHARDLFELKNEEIEEQRKLDAMIAHKKANDAQRAQDEREEQARVNQQSRVVTSLQNKEIYKQKQREAELDTLKSSSAQPY